MAQYILLLSAKIFTPAWKDIILFLTNFFIIAHKEHKDTEKNIKYLI